MAHIKTFEEHRSASNKPVNEFFNSKKKKDEIASSKKEFEKQLKDFEDKGFTVQTDFLTKKAEENKFRGQLVPRKKRDGTPVVIYKDGLTKLQKIATGTGSMTRGESLDNEDLEEFDTDEYEDDDDINEEDEFDSSDDVEQEILDLIERESRSPEEDEEDEEDEESKLERKLSIYEKRNFIVKKSLILEKARNNNFKGETTIYKSKKTGKTVVGYKEGLSKLEKLALMR